MQSDLSFLWPISAGDENSFYVNPFVRLLAFPSFRTDPLRSRLHDSELTSRSTIAVGSPLVSPGTVTQGLAFAREFHTVFASPRDQARSV